MLLPSGAWERGEGFTQRRTNSKTLCSFIKRSHHRELGDCQRVPPIHYQTDWKPAALNDCQWEGQTDRQRGGHRKEGGFLPPCEGFLPFGKEQAFMVADTVLDTFCWVPVLTHNFGRIQTSDSENWLEKAGIDLIWETLLVPRPRELIV